MPTSLRLSISSWQFSSALFYKSIRLATWMLVFALIANKAFAEPLNVSVVLSEEGGVYQEFSDSLRSHLAKQDVILSVTAMNQPVRDSDLIIAVGMKAATALAAFNTAAVLNVFIPRDGYNKLQSDFPKRMSVFSAIYLDQPIERQLDLIAAALPNVRHIGLLYSEPPNDLSGLRHKVSARKMTLHEQIVTPEIALPMALQVLLHNSEVILALPDAEVYNASTIRNILLAAYRENVPVIGFSSSFVRAGALCAVFSTPAHIASQTASVIDQFAKTRILPAAQYAREFDVMVNTQVTRSLNLSVPPPGELRSEIGGAR